MHGKNIKLRLVVYGVILGIITGFLDVTVGHTTPSIVGLKRESRWAATAAYTPYNTRSAKSSSAL
jgi:hypothetical protein